MAWRLFGRGDDEHSAGWSGFLDRAVKFEGTLEVGGTFRLDGMIKGTVLSQDTFIVGETGQGEGGLQGNHVIVAGRFEGMISAKSRVEIRPTGVVTGEIHTPCLVIEPGGVFDGRCHMLPTGDQAEAVTIPVRPAADQS